MDNKILNQYLELLNYDNIPDFIIKYLEVPSLIRLKEIGYFCGMDYASKDIYDFDSYISRFDHSLTTALLTWLCTKEEKPTIAALFHDISTPCFSHVIDYMNKDYETQESTEKNIESILKKDRKLINYLKKDNIKEEEIINFKKYSIVDLDRPMLCADRLDGIILTSLFWIKDMKIQEAEDIIKTIKVYKNEHGNYEIGFNAQDTTQMLIEKNNLIDIYCHSKEDNYMMELLACITKLGINEDLFSYEDLFLLTENEIVKRIINSNNQEIVNLWNRFTTIKKEEIPNIQLPLVKKRVINPLVNGKRMNIK